MRLAGLEMSHSLYQVTRALGLPREVFEIGRLSKRRGIDLPRCDAYEETEDDSCRV